MLMLLLMLPCTRRYRPGCGSVPAISVLLSRHRLPMALSAEPSARLSSSFSHSPVPPCRHFTCRAMSSLPTISSRPRPILSARLSPRVLCMRLQVFDSHSCPASECMLFCKDMWEAKHRRIFMNPRVRFTYNFHSQLYQRVVVPLLNTMLFSWSNRASATHHSLRAPGIKSALGSTVPWTERSFDDLSYGSLPMRLACGLSEDDRIIP